MMHRRCILFVVFSIVVAAQACSGDEQSEGDRALAGSSLPTGVEVFEKLTESADLLQNAAFTSTWEEEWAGVLKSWEDQTFYWDDLGRRRVIYESGSFDEGGGREKSSDRNTTDLMCNGEVLVQRQYHSNRDRVGRKLDAPSESSGYKSAIVSQIDSNLRKALDSHRNPLEYLRNIVIRELDLAISEQRDVTVRRPADDSSVLSVSYSEPPDSRSGFSRTDVKIDPNRGWSVTELVSYVGEDKTVRIIDCIYQQQDSGLWAPVKGVHRHWGPEISTSEPPIFEWRFEVSEVKVNDPEFSEELFAARFEPDTAISDTRYDVSYRIGDQAATESNLAALAERARTEEEVGGALQLTSSKSVGIGRWLLIINGGIVVIVALVLFMRSYGSRQ